MAQELHPIQLQSIRILELSLKVSDLSRVDEEGIDLPFSFGTGHSQFDSGKGVITVGAKAEVGKPTDELISPFYIKAHLIGQFSIDVTKFPVDKIDHWAANNAPLLLLPFLREHIYGLASRAGIKGVIVPLYVLPSFKVTAPE